MCCGHSLSLKSWVEESKHTSGLKLDRMHLKYWRKHLTFLCVVVWCFGVFFKHSITGEAVCVQENDTKLKRYYLFNALFWRFRKGFVTSGDRRRVLYFVFFDSTFFFLWEAIFTVLIKILLVRTRLKNGGQSYPKNAQCIEEKTANISLSAHSVLMLWN